MQIPRRRVRLVALVLVASYVGIGCGTTSTANDQSQLASQQQHEDSRTAGSENAPAETPGAAAVDISGGLVGASRLSDAAAELLTVKGSTTDDKTLDTATLIGQDVAIWFWAPWCEVCNAEAPEVARAFAIHGAAIQFVGVPARDTAEEMRNFVTRYGLESFPHLMDEDRSIWAHFGVPGQPSWVFVNDDGTIWRHIGAPDEETLNAQLDALSDL